MFTLPILPDPNKHINPTQEPQRMPKSKCKHSARDTNNWMSIYESIQKLHKLFNTDPLPKSNIIFVHLWKFITPNFFKTHVERRENYFSNKLMTLFVWGNLTAALRLGHLFVKQKDCNVQGTIIVVGGMTTKWYGEGSVRVLGGCPPTDGRRRTARDKLRARAALAAYPTGHQPIPHYKIFRYSYITTKTRLHELFHSYITSSWLSYWSARQQSWWL